MFVTDPSTSSYNMDGVKDQSDKDQDSYNKQKEADAQEWITLSEKKGNRMANGDIKTSGQGKHIREVIAREVAKDNFDYMDAVTSQLVLGIIPLVIGIGLIYWVSRRKFYRRNAVGAEGFSSFESSSQP